MMNIDAIIKEAQILLSDNSEWEERYNVYAKNLLANIDIIKSNRSKFNEFPPLYFYISTTNAKNAKSKLIIDVRYRGQSVATLKANNNGITISTKEQKCKNLRDFGCDIELNDIAWQEIEVSKFRIFFRNRANSRNDNDKNKSNEEHNIENLLLSEFSKRKSNDKQITGIQPIKIGGIRFGMPTPLSASDHKVLKYAAQYGGGIDIFARTGKGRATNLTVIEVKDENVSNEPPEDALKQAIQYTVFIRELLRSNCGKDWYKLFGFTGAIPKNLKIRAVCAMPDDNADKSFAKQTYQIGDDKIECHYIYFKYDRKQLTGFQSSL
jgi:hypothetical protein